MDKPILTAKAVFDRAHEITAPEGRRAYLDEACGDNAELRQCVEALLRIYHESFLDQPAAAPSIPLLWHSLLFRFIPTDGCPHGLMIAVALVHSYVEYARAHSAGMPRSGSDSWAACR